FEPDAVALLRQRNCQEFPGVIAVARVRLALDRDQLGAFRDRDCPGVPTESHLTCSFLRRAGAGGALLRTQPPNAGQRRMQCSSREHANKASSGTDRSGFLTRVASRLLRPRGNRGPAEVESSLAERGACLPLVQETLDGGFAITPGVRRWPL